MQRAWIPFASWLLSWSCILGGDVAVASSWERSSAAAAHRRLLFSPTGDKLGSETAASLLRLLFSRELKGKLVSEGKVKMWNGDGWVPWPEQGCGRAWPKEFLQEHSCGASGAFNICYWKTGARQEEVAGWGGGEVMDLLWVGATACSPRTIQTFLRSPSLLFLPKPSIRPALSKLIFYMVIIKLLLPVLRVTAINVSLNVTVS